MRNIFLLLCLLGSCAHTVPLSWTEIPGRDESLPGGEVVRHPLYRAHVPSHWVKIPPQEEESIADTTKPNYTFVIEDKIHVTVHTFPSISLEERIPPKAQVERWRRQLAPFQEVIEGVARGGFVGLFYEGKQATETVLAWSMQLDPDHYLTLQFLEDNPQEREFYKQMRADYTIKAKGPSPLIEHYRQELMDFARSFELIEELPSRR